MPTGNGPGGTPSRQAREERLKTIPLTNRIIEKLNAGATDGSRLWRRIDASSSRGTRRGDLTMFGQLGQMAGMMKNLPKLQKQMEEYQQRINSLTAEGNAGGNGDRQSERQDGSPQLPDHRRSPEAERPRNAGRPDRGGHEPGDEQGASSPGRGDVQDDIRSGPAAGHEYSRLELAYL